MHTTKTKSVTQTLRFPLALHLKITKEAKKQDRSFNYMAIAILSKTLKKS